MPAYVFQNFSAANRKRNLIRFSLVQAAQDLSGIDDAPSAALASVTVPYSAAPVFDTGKGQILSITLTGNVTSSRITYSGGTPPVGTQVYLRIIQDATGGRTFAFPLNLRVDVAYAIDGGANRCTVLPIQFIGTNWEFFAAPESFPTI